MSTTLIARFMGLFKSKAKAEEMVIHTVPTVAKPIRELFPLKVTLTKKIIKEGRKHLYNPDKCIGAIVMNSLLISEPTIYRSWGLSEGYIILKENAQKYIITTKENVNLTDVMKPITLTFILKYHS